MHSSRFTVSDKPSCLPQDASSMALVYQSDCIILLSQITNFPNVCIQANSLNRHALTTLFCKTHIIPDSQRTRHWVSLTLGQANLIPSLPFRLHAFWAHHYWCTVYISIIVPLLAEVRMYLICLHHSMYTIALNCQSTDHEHPNADKLAAFAASLCDALLLPWLNTAEWAPMREANRGTCPCARFLCCVSMQPEQEDESTQAHRCFQLLPFQTKPLFNSCQQTKHPLRI